MSLKKHQVWAMMPLLGILFMSPDDVSVKYGRHIASQEPVPESQEQQPQAQEQQPQVAQPQVQEPQPQVTQQPQPEVQESRPASQTPKLDALLAGREIPSREVPVGLTANAVKEQISGVLSRAETATERTNDASQADMAKLDEVKAELIASAIELRQIENLIPGLSSSEESEDLSQRINQAKVQLEGYIGDYEGSLAIVAAREATPVPEVAGQNTPARAPSVVTEETKPETPATPAAPATVTETKPETKPESKPETEEKDPILCALEEQNKLLQTQLQTMVQQQSMILQAMMQLTQSMMLQNMYNVRDTFNYQQAYQYHQPQVAGNWVYYPNGLQPIQPGQTMPGQPDQSTIFGNQQPQPQFNPYMMGQQQPQFPFAQPGMMNQGGMWGLQPQMQFQHNPGNFGMDALGFNFGNSPVAPSQQSPMFNSGFQFI